MPLLLILVALSILSAIHRQRVYERRRARAQAQLCYEISEALGAMADALERGEVNHTVCETLPRPPRRYPWRAVIVTSLVVTTGVMVLYAYGDHVVEQRHERAVNWRPFPDRG